MTNIIAKCDQHIGLAFNSIASLLYYERRSLGTQGDFSRSAEFVEEFDKVLPEKDRGNIEAIRITFEDAWKKVGNPAEMYAGYLMKPLAKNRCNTFEVYSHNKKYRLAYCVVPGEGENQTRIIWVGLWRKKTMKQNTDVDRAITRCHRICGGAN